VNVTGDLRKLMRKLIKIQNKASSSLTRVSKFALRIEKMKKEPMITNAVLLPAGTEH
jgi:D-arabinose 5-phosphate isomerase GutQ